MNVTAALSHGAARLVAAETDTARLDARVLLAEIVHVPPSEVRGLSRNLRPDEEADYDALIARRAAREPLAYIVGRKEFWSLDFAVGPGALVPRPETETVIEQALKAFPDKSAPLRILDLGTGSGCLLVTALTLYPNATGTGIDLSPDALDWARRNASRHGVETRARLVEGSWDAARPGPYELILANPPYIASAEMADLGPELGHEPASALESGPDGLEAYRALAPVLKACLAPDSWAFLEIGSGQGSDVASVLMGKGLEIAGLTPDLAGIPRVVAVRQPATAAAAR